MKLYLVLNKLYEFWQRCLHEHALNAPTRWFAPNSALFFFAHGMRGKAKNAEF